MKKPQCFFCGAMPKQREQLDSFCVAVSIAPRVWFEGKLTEGAVDGLHAMCPDCQREIREFILAFRSEKMHQRNG